MTTTDQTPLAGSSSTRRRRGVRLRWIGLGLGVVAIAAIVFWATRQGGTSAPPPEQPAQAAVPVALGVRLTLVTGAPGDDAAAVVRLYNARARLDQTVRDASPSGREWGGEVGGDGERAVQLQFGLDGWRSSLRIERVDESGVATPLPDGAFSIVAAPEGPLAFTGTDTHTVILTIQASGLPPPGGRVRVQMVHAAVAGVSNAALVGEPPADRVERLGRSARVAELTGRFDRVAERAAEIIAASPASAVGYWYQGVALEAGGDIAGAIAAFEAASARVVPGGQEPPIGLDLRIARLRRR